MSRVPKGLRKVLIGAAGAVVLAVGLAMVVLPGPAVLVILLGLGILALEFEWARRIRDRGLAWLRKRKRDWDDRKGPKGE